MSFTYKSVKEIYTAHDIDGNIPSFKFVFVEMEYELTGYNSIFSKYFGMCIINDVYCHTGALYDIKQYYNPNKELFVQIVNEHLYCLIDKGKSWLAYLYKIRTNNAETNHISEFMNNNLHLFELSQPYVLK